MTPPDQTDDQPSALSRLERALAGFGEPQAEPTAPDEEPEPEPEPEAEPVSPFEAALEVEDEWDEPTSVASSPVLDIASAVEAVERLGAARESRDAEAGDALLDRPLSDADEFVLAATAEGRQGEAGLGAEPAAEHDEAPGFQPADLRARVREFADEQIDDEALRSAVDEGSDLAAPDEEEPPPPRVADAAASWARDIGDAQLPYFLVEDDVPVAAAPSATLEELRQASPMTETEKRPASVARTLAEIPILLIVAAVIAFLVKTFLAQAYYIPSGSMLPQLRIDDRVVVSKLAYKLHDPRRGDIVVFDDPRNGESDTDDGNLLRKIGEGIGIVQPSTDEFIKRVIGLPGDTVEGRDGHVYVNGRLLVEPYLTADVVTSDFPRTRVSNGRLWVMGDNRSGSADSRVFGQIKIDTIVGRAMVVVWPFDHVEFL